MSIINGYVFFLPSETVIVLFFMVLENRFSHRSPMQTEKYQPEGKRRMPETRFTELSAFSVDPRVGISRSASETDADREIPT